MKSKIRYSLAALSLTGALSLQAAPAWAQDSGAEPAAEVAALDAGPAPAAPEAAEGGAEEADPGGWLKDGYEAVEGGRWREAAALAIILLVWSIRKFKWLRKLFPDWFGTDRGGVALVLGTSFLGAAAHAVLAGASLGSWGLWKSAGIIAIEAIGGYVGFKKLIWPKE